MSVDFDDYDDDEQRRQMSKELVEQAELQTPVTKEEIDFVIECMTKEAPHDRQSIKQLFLGMLSGFTKLVIHHAVSSKDAGAGKTYLVILVAGYIPKAYVIPLSGMSDKAMLHKAGILVVQDDDGRPVPLDPLLRDLEDRKETALDELAEYGHYFACYHCYDYSKAIFRTIDEYNRHIVMNHKPATVGYPGYPDREKLELERVRRKQGNGKWSGGGLRNDSR